MYNVTWYNTLQQLVRVRGFIFWYNFTSLETQTERFSKDIVQSDRQKVTYGGLTNTHTSAGVYILTQRVQTWGNIFRGHTERRVKDRRTQTEGGKTNTRSRGGSNPDTTCTNLRKHFQRTHVTGRCVKYTQGAWKTNRRNRKENTLTLTREWEFSTSWHNVYKPGETFLEDTRHRQVCEMQTDARKTYRQKRKEDTLTLHVLAGVYILTQRVQANLGKHLQRTHSEVCERQQTGWAKDIQTEAEVEYTNTHTGAGVYILTQRVQTWGNICRGHTVKCVKDNRQDTWKTDRQKRRRTHSHSRARGGLHPDKTWGNIFRGHIITTQWNKYKIC